MVLVQLFLPKTDNAGRALPRALFARVRAELVDRFGGVTAYSRSAKGIWLDDDDEPVDDDLVVYEVVVEHVDSDWWQPFVTALESDFRQRRLHVRALEMALL